MMIKRNVLPCPFCGEPKEETIGQDMRGNIFEAATCLDCLGGKRIPLEIWNKRARLVYPPEI